MNVGQRVRILTQPLMGRHGVVVGHDTDGRLRVQVQFVGIEPERLPVTTLDVADLVAVDD